VIGKIFVGTTYVKGNIEPWPNPILIFASTFYFDTAINEYLRDLPHNYIEHVKQTGTDFHVVKVTVEFFAPSHFDDEIEVCVRTGQIGRSSLTFCIEIFPKNSETTLVKGEVVWVNTDQKAHKSVPLPEGLIVKLRNKDGGEI